MEKGKEYYSNLRKQELRKSENMVAEFYKNSDSDGFFNYLDSLKKECGEDTIFYAEPIYYNLLPLMKEKAESAEQAEIRAVIIQKEKEQDIYLLQSKTVRFISDSELLFYMEEMAGHLGKRLRYFGLYREYEEIVLYVNFVFEASDKRYRESLYQRSKGLLSLERSLISYGDREEHDRLFRKIKGCIGKRVDGVLIFKSHSQYENYVYKNEYE